jgi:hypothetical protein
MISLANVEKVAETVIQGVIDHEDLINVLATATGTMLPVTYAEKTLPAIVAALQLLQQDSGKPWIEVFVDFINHITPGKAAAEVLGPAAPSAAPAAQ